MEGWESKAEHICSVTDFSVELLATCHYNYYPSSSSGIPMKNEGACTHNLTHDGGGGDGDSDGGADAHHSLSSSCHVTTDLQPLPVPTQAALKLTSSLPPDVAGPALDKSVPDHEHEHEHEHEHDQGLSPSFRMSVIVASVLMMAVVVLCLTVVLPRTARKHESELNRKSQFHAFFFGIDPRSSNHFSDVPSYLDFAVGTAPDLHRRHRKHEIPPQELPPAASALISKACGATLLPQVCRMSLESDPAIRSASSLLSIIDIALEISRSQILSCTSLSDALLHSSAAAFNVNLTDAARECSYLLSRAESFHGRSKAASFTIQKPWQVADSQAWMSAALTYENDCRSALSYVNVTTSVDYLMGQVSYAINLTSNALAMIGAVRAGNGDWEPPNRLTLYSAVAPPPRSSSGSVDRWWYQRASATVAKDGSGDYSTVQAAVDMAPDGGSEWYTIHIKEGVYEEIVRVPPSKKRLAMVGDGMGRTVITGSLNAQMPGVTTYDTATVGVGGDEFMAVGMTFENTAGAAKHQAVAVMVDSDFSAFYNCSFLGHQDTLYAHALRHLYHGCRIEGTVDFIFGNAAAVFEECEIIFRPGLLLSGSGSTTSMATAQGRTDPGETTGLVFHHCTLDGTPEFRQQWAAGRNHAYLGRPWKLFSRTVFLECSLPDFLEPQGWLPWRGDFALSTLFYGEYLNSGPGARPASVRVPWSQQLSYETASLFSVDPFIQGDRWLPDPSSSHYIPSSP